MEAGLGRPDLRVAGSVVLATLGFVVREIVARMLGVASRGLYQWATRRGVR